MQKRRRSKAVPKDIFGNAPKPVASKKEVIKQPQSSKPLPPPEPAPVPEIKDEEEPPVIEDRFPNLQKRFLNHPMRMLFRVRYLESLDVSQ